MQIIKEKLVFPSGTATAQLISVLHKTPLRRPISTSTSPNSDSESSVRRRGSAGYEALEADEPTDSLGRQSLDSHNGTKKDAGAEREALMSVGWTLLGWSFAASAALTVRSSFFHSADS